MSRVTRALMLSVDQLKAVKAACVFMLALGDDILTADEKDHLRAVLAQASAAARSESPEGEHESRQAADDTVGGPCGGGGASIPSDPGT